MYEVTQSAALHVYMKQAIVKKYEYRIHFKIQKNTQQLNVDEV